MMISRLIELPTWRSTAFYLLLLMFLYPQGVHAGENLNARLSVADTNTINKKRLTGVIATGSVAYLGSMSALYFAWYKNHPQTSFHFYNDFSEWMQMDKGGHMVASYYIGMLGYESLRWAGVERKKAIWYGGSFGSVYLSAIEILDGFSSGWGFSLSDLTANTLGSAIFISQQLSWDEQRVLLKYSYHPTKFANYRPEVLGSNHLERMLKDYNGITYWLSANPGSFGLNRFPAWLNIALGYSATGMTGGSENMYGYHNGKFIPYFSRDRQFLFSLDIDFSKIKTRTQSLGLVLKALGFIKIPFPALEFNTNKKFVFHPLYL
ncbi:MAG: DUF2279 domain-containing protein [Bacteroidales bacterium]|nr:DUF2279 domain-containing protein [Bacteroidales bacterium]